MTSNSAHGSISSMSSSNLAFKIRPSWSEIKLPSNKIQVSISQLPLTKHSLQTRLAPINSIFTKITTLIKYWWQRVNRVSMTMTTKKWRRNNIKLWINLVSSWPLDIKGTLTQDFTIASETWPDVYLQWKSQGLLPRKLWKTSIPFLIKSVIDNKGSICCIWMIMYRRKSMSKSSYAIQSNWPMSKFTKDKSMIFDT